MRRRLSHFAFALVAACTGPSVGGRDAPLTMATDDDGDPGVVAIVASGDPAELRCSGALVDERVVLTAAHCDVASAPEQLAVFFGPDVRRPGTVVRILEVLVHPDADASADADLALLLLAEPAPAPPVRLAADAAIGEPPPVSVRVVGYGMTAAGAEDDVRKREGRARTDEVTPQHVLLGADPSLACNGDSGGPVLVAVPGGEALAAVISRGDAACTERFRATRVDAHLESFLRPALDAWAAGSRAAGEACLYDAHCESGRCAETLDDPTLRFCASPCAADAECAEPLACQEALCRHPVPSPGALGATCAEHDDCARGDCVDELGICSTRCVGGRGDCPDGYGCEHLGGIDFYCVPEPPPEGCACAARPGPPGLPAALLLVVLLLRTRRV